jgi:hypothetical protein
MEKETSSGDDEMVGLPQSGGGRRQGMVAGGKDQEDRSTGCSAASSAMLRPDELSRDLEKTRPDASAADFQGTPRRTAGNRLQDDKRAAVGRSREGNKQQNSGKMQRSDKLRREGKVTGSRREGKAAVGRSRNGGAAAETTAAKEEKQQKRDRLRKRNVLAVRRSREAAGSSDSENSGDDCRNGGAAEETAAIEEIDWEDEELWLGALAEAGISWNGTMQEFIQSESMAEGARAEWENGTKELRSRIIDLMGGSDVRNPAVRLASAFRDSYDTVSWNARAVRFAAFVSDAISDQDGGGGGDERLTAVGEEIAELEERLQELRAEQQELEAEQQQDRTITVGNLAWNVTSDMLRGTFDQVAKVLDAAVQYDEDTGRSLGWAVVEFRGASDAAAAAESFNGVELASKDMVVEIGDGRDCGEGEPEGELDQGDQ